jgi:hypothetical protein
VAGGGRDRELIEIAASNSVPMTQSADLAVVIVELVRRHT